MKLSDFILLGEKEKMHTVLHEGVLIAKRQEPASFFFLFQFQSFYVETCFNIANKGVEEFRVFHETELLQPYLERMPLDDLLN